MIKPNFTYSRLRPLIFYKDKLIVSKRNILYSIGTDFKLTQIFKIKLPKYLKFLFYFKKFERLFRLGVNASILHKKNFFFSFNKSLYKYDFSKNILLVEHKFINGRGPLNFSLIEGIRGFKDSVYFGEYFSNNKKKEVLIYSRNNNKNSWEVIYIFKNGEINHIHSLIPDKMRNCIWILAGDFGEAASIWKAKNGFKEIEKVVSNHQKFRSCVAFPISEGLLYATDTQFEGNSIRILIYDGMYWKSKKIASLNGPCIHGMELKDYFVFSTATEPDAETSNSYLSLFDNKLANEIKKNRSEIIIMNKKNKNFKLLYSLDKDKLPYRLFQFGNFFFPQKCRPYQ